MRNTLTRIGAFIASLFAGAPPPKRSHVAARQNMRMLATDEVSLAKKPRHRLKTGGPNWLKIAINQQKRR